MQGNGEDLECLLHTGSEVVSQMEALSEEWYPGLTAQSSVAKFQAVVHASDPTECPAEPCAEQAAPAEAHADVPPEMQHMDQMVNEDSHVHVPNINVSTIPLVWRSNVGLDCKPPLVPIVQAEAVQDGLSSQSSPSDGMACGCLPPKILDKTGKLCKEPSGMAKMAFYVYRAQSDSEYPLENVNVADLPGVMWYLHNEVVPSVPRKFGVTRVMRYKLTMKNTEEFYSQFPKQFGPFVAFDSAKCTAPWCNEIWEKHGFVIGCQNLDRYVANYVRDYVPPPANAREMVVRQLKEDHGDEGEEDEEMEVAARSSMRGRQGQKHDERHSEKHVPKTTRTATMTVTTTMRPHITDSFHGGIWYSLPGSCPESFIEDKNASCIKRMPGGRCPKGAMVDGSTDCTYDYEPAGEISLDELSGILDPARGVNSYDEWWKTSYELCLNSVARGEREGPCEHRMEYSTKIDQGVGTDFWNGKHDLKQGVRRMNRVRQLFREKYPHLPDDIAGPACL
eukprot:CAMPEP_0177487408 /NCGR_PEP_ID=MMETSP0369-20130122/29606_1 /TAXON_ID=447022 ORGANISM="Scrippsiella hangoei-like, Strain SHHI-4" /NCGR_SAMPLE_ID=MMETSP0369 /ASSEMBLY_ACC=CAM_ASM_000364 /LENGTH=505 /DNA_ID=CAMNT_0018963707 /DNA_START=1 /DNA_END=1518 /DNA_ORIENTATION=-